MPVWPKFRARALFLDEGGREGGRCWGSFEGATGLPKTGSSSGDDVQEGKGEKPGHGADNEARAGRRRVRICASPDGAMKTHLALTKAGEKIRNEASRRHGSIRRRRAPGVESGKGRECACAGPRERSQRLGRRRRELEPASRRGTPRHA